LSNSADAELNIVVNDNVAQASSRILGQVRALGTAMNAEAGKIDRAAAGVARSLHRMTDGAAGAGVGSRGYGRSIAQATANLSRYRSEMERLSHVERAQTNSAGRKYDPSTGRLISRADMEAYDNAATRVKVYGDELDRLNRIQSEMGQSRGFQQGVSARAADYSRYKQEAEGLSRSTKDLERLYTGMWGKVESVNGRNTSWFPPQMLRSTRDFAQTIAEASNSTRYAMYDMSRSMAVGGAAVLALGAASVVFAARWEAAFASVERTVGGNSSTLETIRQGLIEMSQDIPVNFTALTEIAALGAQMGIAADGIVAYTDVIAKLTATTNLSEDAAGKALGRFRSFFAVADDPSLAVSERTFSNLASSILKVGVNSVATETGIVNVATQISSMAAYAGLTANQVIGLAGALSSVGVPPELSRGVTTRLFTLMGNAAATGGAKLDNFAHVAGVSAEEFANAWGTDRFAYIFTDFISGLNRLNQDGGRAVGVLQEMGITSVRDVPVLLRLAGAADEAGRAGGLLAQTMNDGLSGWRQNIELQLQYQKVAQTLSARFTVLIQNFEALFATMGQSSVGPIKAVVDAIIQVVRGFTLLIDSPVGQVLGTITIAVSVLGGALLLLTAGAVRGVASMQALSAGITSLTGSATIATAAVRGLTIAMGVIGVVGAIVAVVGTVAALGAAATDASGAINDTAGALAAMKEDTVSGTGFFALQEGLDAAGTAAVDLDTHADNLTKVLGETSDAAFGNADALSEVGASAEQAALQYGRATADFARNSVIASKAFQDIFVMDNGGDFADRLRTNGFNLDEALKIATQQDRRAVRDYIESVAGVEGIDIGDIVSFNRVTSGGFSDEAQALLDVLDSTGAQLRGTASAAYASGEAFTAYRNATELTTEALNEFETANQETLGKVGQGFAKFVDTASLIEFTQNYKQAIATMDDAETEVDEAAEAAEKYDQAWSDAFGGISFTLEEYMGTFRGAAAEQTSFIENIQTLFGRGIPTNIIQDLAAMGPEASQLVQAMVNATDAELDAFVELYGTTGFDSMVALATGQMAADMIVRNAARHLSVAQLQQMSADLSAGTPLADAMKKWDLDAEGNPLTPPVRPEMDAVADRIRFQNEMIRWGLYAPVRLTLDDTAVRQRAGTAAGGYRMFASGGYTGNGGKYDYAGAVHKGEFVMNKEATSRIGVGNLYALMRNSKGGRPAARSGGFAGGGYAGSSSPVGVVHFAPEERQLLMDIRDAIGRGFVISEGAIGAAATSSAINSMNRRRG
jgi:TP901 family phage tail tape measure protein